MSLDLRCHTLLGQQTGLVRSWDYRNSFLVVDQVSVAAALTVAQHSHKEGTDVVEAVHVVVEPGHPGSEEAKALIVQDTPLLQETSFYSGKGHNLHAAGKTFQCVRRL